MTERMPDPKRSPLFFLFRQKLPLESETSLYILVSTLDILMTWILLYRGGFVEANPVARFFLEGWGLKGFVGFKFALVCLVCVIAQVIAITRQDIARRILLLGTLVVAVVVIYSFTLLLRHG